MKNEKKKITFFTADFPPTGGGIATYVNEWVIKSAERPSVQNVSIFVFNNSAPRKEKITDKLKVTAYKGIGFFYCGLTIPFLMLLNIRSKLFHSLNLFPIGFWVIFWSKLFFKRSAITFYGTDACTSQGRPLTKKLKKWTIDNADIAITISNFTREETKKILQISKDVRVIYPPLPLHTLGAANEAGALDSRIHEEDFVVLSVSRMVQRKGLEILIRAISMIDDHRVKAVLVGGGPEKEKLEKLAKDLGLINRIIFTGKVPSVQAYYKRAQVSVLLSNYLKEEGDFEGLGFVLIEAQYYGNPVIGSNSGGIPETFQNNRTGIMVPEHSPERTRDAILKLMRDENLRMTMSKESLKFVFERYHPEKNIDSYINLV